MSFRILLNILFPEKFSAYGLEQLSILVQMLCVLKRMLQE
jgi:hypothetical protein